MIKILHIDFNPENQEISIAIDPQVSCGSIAHGIAIVMKAMIQEGYTTREAFLQQVATAFDNNMKGVKNGTTLSKRSSTTKKNTKSNKG